MSRSTPALDQEQHVEAALETVSQREGDFETACREHADAESVYRINYAAEFLKASGTEKAREATAITAVAHMLTERNRKRAIEMFTKEKLKDAQQAVFARQTLLNAALKTNDTFSQ